MFHKIKNVTALPDNKLCIQFSEGITKLYDISRLPDSLPVFSKLINNNQLFYDVKVDTGGYGIIWNEYFDLSCDELWDNGIKVNTPFDNLLSFADACELWGLNESTLRKAVAYGRLVNSIDVCKFGKQWVITIDAMRREYGNPV